MYGFITIIIAATFFSASLSVDNLSYEDGFYLTTACGSTEKPMPVVLTEGKKTVCLPNKPIVEFSEVISISGLVNIPAQNHSAFRIILSEEAFQKLKKLASQLPTNVYAFAFKDQVFFTFEIDIKKFNPIIEVKGNLGSKEIKSLHQQLERALRDGS